MLHLYYYYSDNCVSCKYLTTFLREFSNDYNKFLKVYFVSIDNKDYNIPGIPYIQFYKQGKDLKKYSLLGSNIGDILNNINIILNQD